MISILAAPLFLFLFEQAVAADTVETRVMTLPLATDIARHAVGACAKSGYSISVVVTDRSGVPLVVMRTVYASGFTTEIAQRKANAVVLSGVSSAEFRSNRADIVAEMNEIDGVLVLAGGLPIRAAGVLLGAVGVSGAPGGDKDERCAQAGLDSVQDRLDFVGE